MQVSPALLPFPVNLPIHWAAARGRLEHRIWVDGGSGQLRERLVLARLVRQALNRGNVLEGPLRDRIADGGNPGAKGR